MRRQEIVKTIAAFTQELAAREKLAPPEKLDENTILFGVDGLLDSLLLAELALKLEQYCETAKIPFSWPEITAAAANNRNLRTIGYLADNLLSACKK